MIILDCRRGQEHPLAKLTDVQAAALRAEYLSLPMSKVGNRRSGVAALAAKYGMTVPGVCKVGRRYLWRHLR